MSRPALSLLDKTKAPGRELFLYFRQSPASANPMESDAAVLFFQSPMLSRAGVTIVSIMTDGSSAYIACGMRVGK